MKLYAGIDLHSNNNYLAIIDEALHRPVHWFLGCFTAHVVNHHRVGLKPFDL